MGSSEILKRVQGMNPHCVNTMSDRLGNIKQVRDAWEQELNDMTSDTTLCEEGKMRPRQMLRELEKAMPSNAMVASDIGNVCSVSNGYLRFPDGGPSMLAAMTFGNCGYSFPAAMGAKIAAPDRPAFAYVGDGAWCMSLNETLTCVRENIPAIAVVFNNGQWGAEKMNQVDFYDNRYVGTNIQNPSFADISKIMGAEGIKVTKP